MASRSIARPAGTPSRIATSALPCDSPAVRKRSIRGSFYPKKLTHLARRHAICRAIRAGHLLALVPRASYEGGRRAACGGPLCGWWEGARAGPCDPGELDGPGWHLRPTLAGAQL